MIDTLPNWVLEISKFAGAAGLIFVIWYLTAKWSQVQFKNFSQLMREERKEQLEAAKEERKIMREELRMERERQFQLIREEREHDYQAQTRIAEAMTMLSAQWSELKTEVKAQGRDLGEIKQFIFRDRK